MKLQNWKHTNSNPVRYQEYNRANLHLERQKDRNLFSTSQQLENHIFYNLKASENILNSAAKRPALPVLEINHVKILTAFAHFPKPNNWKHTLIGDNRKWFKNSSVTPQIYQSWQVTA